jgi:predicted nucleic acid-binding protein
MKPSLYLETTIPSFLVGNISSVLVTAAHQATTRRWWEEQRDHFRIFVSSLVEDEIAAGELGFAKQRQSLIADFPRLEVTDTTTDLAIKLHVYLHLPSHALLDAVHLALACYYEVDYLLTWNMKHLANAHVRHGLQRLHDSKEIYLPTICTPEELIEELEI